MKDFKINHATIENFRVFDRLEADLWNKTEIFGDNAVGKTSLASAILWCLTGKDADGSTSFEIVPMGQYSKVSPAVTLECNVGDKPVTLKREYKAKYARDKSFAGYATTTYINGVETGVRNFGDWISTRICNEQVFKILSNPKTFTENCPREPKELVWQAERRLLLSILGDQKSDSDIAESDDKWVDLVEPLKRYESATTYLAFLKKQYSELQKKLDEFGIRIEQQEKNIKPEPHTESEIAELVNQVKSDAADLKTKNEDYKRQRRTGIADEIKDKIAEATKRRDAMLKGYTDDMQVFARAKASYQTQADEAKRKCDEKSAELKKYIEALEKLKSAPVREVCDKCGQRIPANRIEAAKKKLAERIENGQKMIANIRDQVAKLNRQWQETQARANGLMEPTYPARVEECNKEIQELTEQLLNVPDGKDMDTFQSEMQALEARMDELKQEYQVIKNNASMTAEIETIENERTECAESISETQRMLDLAREFVSYRCSSSEDAINALFDNVKFQLFERNKSNDEIKETCILRFKGVKYQDLSYSTKIIASVEVLRAFQKFYGVTVPCILDNSESITGNVDTGAQTIYMKVREEFCPECNGESGRRNQDGTWTCKRCGHVWKKKLEIREV